MYAKMMIHIMFMTFTCLFQMSMGAETVLSKSLFESCGQRIGVKKGDRTRLNLMSGSTGDTVNVSACFVTFYSLTDGRQLEYTVGKDWKLWKDELISGTSVVVLTSTKKDKDTNDWVKSTVATKSDFSVAKKIVQEQVRIEFKNPQSIKKMDYFNLFFTISGEKASVNMRVSVGAVLAMVIVSLGIY